MPGPAGSLFGELGWELTSIESAQAVRCYSKAGEAWIDRLRGYAMNVMRIKKAYKAHGFELTTE